MLKCSLLCLFALAASASAASFPKTIRLFVPVNGTAANTSLSDGGGFGFSEDGDLQSGVFDRNISTHITYPNGTRLRGGSVASGICPTPNGGGTAKYSFGIGGTEAGLYTVEVNATYSIPPSGGNCSSPRTLWTSQSSFAQASFTMSEPVGPRAPSANQVTTTATLLPTPTGSYKVSSATASTISGTLLLLSGLALLV